MLVAPVQPHLRLTIYPTFLSLLDDDKALLRIIITRDHVLDRFFSNHPYTAFFASFVNYHSNHVFVYGLYLLCRCLLVKFTEVGDKVSPTSDLSLCSD